MASRASGRCQGNAGAAAFHDAVDILDDSLGNRMANILLAHHAPVKVTDDPDGHTALMCVIGSNNPALVKKIIQHGGNINAVDSSDNTPRDWGAVMGDNPAIRLLLAYGASLNRKMRDGTTALTRAVIGEHPDTVRLLLACGAVRDAQALKEAASLRDPATLKLLRAGRGRRRPAHRRDKFAAHFVRGGA